jgi:geranylgeranyl diphosphate synthase type I
VSSTALSALRERLDRELRACLAASPAWRELADHSPEVFSRVETFVFAAGKRLRPLLFTLLYRGYARQPAAGAVQVALALELLHAFVLIHDDIVDRSPLRRVGPTLHRRFAADLDLAAHGRVQGEDLALVAGDVLYALALHLYQTAELPPALREQGMVCLTEAALLTGQGELRELLQTLRPPATVVEAELIEIYDLKTAHYTFCCPMVLAATLGEAPAADHAVLRELGLLLGRA